MQCDHKDSQWSLVLLAQRAYKTGPRSYDFALKSAAYQKREMVITWMVHKAKQQQGLRVWRNHPSLFGFLKSAMGEQPKSAWFGYVLAGCVCRGLLIPVHTYWFLSSQDNESLTRCLLVRRSIKRGGNWVKGKCNLNIVGKN